MSAISKLCVLCVHPGLKCLLDLMIVISSYPPPKSNGWHHLQILSEIDIVIKCVGRGVSKPLK